MKFPTILPIKTIVLVLALLVAILIYYGRTGRLPSFTPETRCIDYSKAYFSKNSDLFIKEVDLNGTGFKSLVAFEKSAYFKKLLVSPKSTEDVKPHYNAVFAAKEISEGTKLVILKPIDLGMLNPLIQLFVPLTKAFEIEIINNKGDNFRIYEVENIDIDNDGRQELIIHWLDYSGGSGGNFTSAVIGYSDGKFKLLDFLPSFEPITIQNLAEQERTTQELKADKQFLKDMELEGMPIDFEEDELHLKKLKDVISRNKAEIKQRGFTHYIETVPCDFIINGDKIRYNASLRHTDNFYRFVQAPTGGYTLITAHSFDDGRCHFCPQSWELASFKFVAKKFVPDNEFPPLKIDKNWDGLSMMFTDIHLHL